MKINTPKLKINITKDQETVLEAPILSARNPAPNADNGLIHILPTPSAPPKTILIIMIDEAGNVRIMDFGIARSLESKSITGAGVMIGTPEYMSPEQVEGKEVEPATYGD